MSVEVQAINRVRDMARQRVEGLEGFRLRGSRGTVSEPQQKGTWPNHLQALRHRRGGNSLRRRKRPAARAARRLPRGRRSAVRVARNTGPLLRACSLSTDAARNHSDGRNQTQLSRSRRRQRTRKRSTACLVNLNSEAGCVRQRQQTPPASAERPLHDVLGEIEMRKADAPVSLRNGAREMQRGRAADARTRRSSRRCSPTGRASDTACRLRSRRAMPPSLISLSETPPAPARALVSMSARLWMPSSMPIGTLLALASFLRPSRSSSR